MFEFLRLKRRFLSCFDALAFCGVLVSCRASLRALQCVECFVVVVVVYRLIRGFAHRGLGFGVFWVFVCQTRLRVLLVSNAVTNVASSARRLH